MAEWQGQRRRNSSVEEPDNLANEPRAVTGCVGSYGLHMFLV